MHIKKLEIAGFKSFVDRTVIHFDHDVIGVVGPNGCGKSNVVDAIRWSMGEQSAKSLRGRAMADVIFNGSESRPPAGFAEVTITFDNSDPGPAQQLPLEYRDYADIAVTRRLHRGDGSNEYFINKVPVRLRDVTEVFLGTGVGRKAYSIVEQGKIGQIVSGRATDRRLLIEEAAGITKYKARKRQAENKMNLTRQNLTRVSDLVGEIERQLGSLKRQSAKAKRYVRYREELDDLVLWEAAHRYLELTAVTGVCERGKVDAEETVRSERAAVDARDAEIEVMRQEAHTAEQTAERTQNDAFLSDNEVREHEARIERASDRFEHLGATLARARSEQMELERKAAELLDEGAHIQEALRGIEDEQQREEQLVAGEADTLFELQREADEATTNLSVALKQEADASAVIAAAAARLDGLDQRQREVAQRHERLDEEHARLDGEHGGLSFRRDEQAQQVSELVNRKHAMCDARDALATELPSLRENVKNEGLELDEARSKLNKASSRRQALKELAERLEGVGVGVRNLLKTGDESLQGLIADRIEVPAELTQAFAGLAGERLQCVIVSDVDQALALLHGLASDRRGRATIIPTELPWRPVSPFDSGEPLPFDDDAFVGRLIDMVSFDRVDYDLVHALIGDTLLVRDDHAARRLVETGIDQNVVTLEGTVFHSDGRITGGAGDHLASGMLEQKREMRELAELVETGELEVAERGASVERQRQHLAGLQEALDQAKNEAHNAEIAMVKGEQNLRRLEQEISAIDKRRAQVGLELAELVRNADSAVEERAEAQAAADESERTRAEAAASVETAQETSATARDAMARQQEVFTERKVLFAAVRERVTASKNALERVEREHGALALRIEELETQRHDAATEAGSTAAAIVAAREALVDARVRSRQARAAFERARVGLDDARHSLALREAELREMRATLDEASSRLQEHEMELQRLIMEHEHLVEGVRERFRGLELRTVVGDFHARMQVGEAQRGRIKELAQLIDRMGSVNLDAMQEYEESAERYEYYTTQKADLEVALSDLETAITQMNRESRRLFKHAFEGINRRFKEIFPKMFRGGRAELRLTTPDDLLESGVDILAQPPGKRLGNLELMSGGEKAFTAVSLLLAIFRFKPSPFCILDEVDAPLDEANVERYVEGIRAMTDRSQFIVITHSKRTMEAVDVLYGVTMQEPGVSKLVGVRVGEAEARSKNRKTTMPSAPEQAEEAETSPATAKASAEPPAVEHEPEVAVDDTAVA